MINKISRLALRLSKSMAWSNVYGLARTLLAIGTLSTLLANSNVTLFGDIHSSKFLNYKVPGLARFSFFYLLNHQLNYAVLIAIACLIIVAIGWRPRITCIIHWYIAFSFNIYTSVADGGDQITTVLTLLLIPICLLDNRTWHWQAITRADQKPYLGLVGYFSYISIRIQIAVLYLDAAVEKFKVAEWKNGTAIWYWLNDPILGCNDFWKPIIIPLLKNPFIVNILTWGPIVFEMILFLGLTLNKRYRNVLLTVGILFHFIILLFHGLISFFFSMSAALILYLRPWEQPFNFEYIASLKQVLLSKASKEIYLKK